MKKIKHLAQTNYCNACGSKLKSGICLADVLSGVKTWDSVDLCEECHTEITLIIENWLNGKKENN